MGFKKPATLHQRLGRRKNAKKKFSGALRPYKVVPLKQKTMEDLKPKTASAVKKQAPKKARPARMRKK